MLASVKQSLKLLRVSLPSSSSSSSLSCTSKRYLPAYAPKPVNKPRYLWDKRDLIRQTNSKYTPTPLRVKRLGGRDPETGRKVNQHIGGGVKFDYFLIDFHRRGPKEEGKTYDERVIEVRRDPNRTSYIALVAGIKGKRWILATENMEAGQIISTTCHIPRNPVIGVEGNAYPLGALTVGTLVNSVERCWKEDPDVIDQDSTVFITSAGTCAEIVRHQGDFVVIKLPHKHEFALRKECMATVGRLSHGDIKDKQFGSAQMHRRFGYKMSSGLFHKKTGYYGRKVKPLPPVTKIDKEEEPPPPFYKMTLTKRQLSGLEGNARVHDLVVAGYCYQDYPD